ncbi:peroxide stress protein YaaA [Parabacteroides bouchesdurhonensis]|uniref:peroxide stress protein YaaA n=1 Tax=Parabacteroides bouchesdurhonensis TaxID=1936995 RepID=UPI000E47FCAD|nr:peroxide stress protein YaaA [Parabacteroides bouchesdurhonensis]RHJ95018.1 peroxide stress protein YaaA [Bacteroides sp. AM07-16]
MLILLSPAKTMTGMSKIKAPEGSYPHFIREANEIALQMTQFPKEELSRILKLSPKLATESYMRFQEFHSEENKPLQAILAYTGVVFKNINPKDFNKEDFLFAQEHMRFVSICYGLLRPLDLIKPYRMEYDVKLPEFGDGNMYAYWRSRQTELLINDIQKAGGLLINLASMDVQPSFEWKEVEKSSRVITPEFKVWKNGKANTIVIYAKMARGQMSRFIIKNRISNPEEIKSFSWEGFSYKEDMSENDKWVFLQE